MPMAEESALHTCMMVWSMGREVRNDMGGRSGDMCMD